MQCRDVELTAEQAAACKQLGLNTDQVVELVEQAPLQVHRAGSRHLPEVPERHRARPAQADPAPRPQKYRPAVRAVLARRDAVRAVRSAADLLPRQERLPRVRRAHVCHGPVAQLAQLHEDAAAHPLPRRPARRRHPQPLHRSRLEHLQPLAGRRHHRKARRRQGRQIRAKRSTARSFSRTATSWTSKSRSRQHEDIYLPYEEIDRAKSRAAGRRFREHRPRRPSEAGRSRAKRDLRRQRLRRPRRPDRPRPTTARCT